MSDIKLFCLVKDDNSDSFSVTISVDSDVEALKMLILPNVIPNIDKEQLPAKARMLILWKPAKPLPDVDPQQIVCSWGNNLSEHAERVGPSRRISDVFKNEAGEVQLGEGLVHIIIERLPVSGSLSERRPPDGATEWPTGEHGRDVKRMRLTNLDPDDVATLDPTLTTECNKIHEELRSLSLTPNDYADPKRVCSLPFPSPLPAPKGRFTLDEKGSFRYMGRSIFSKLYSTVQTLRSRYYHEKIYLYGTSGSGKSYILAALACLLYSEGKPVVYIPDCRLLVDDLLANMKKALCFTYADSLDHLASARNIEDLIEFCISRKERIYFIVDQYNALDISDSDARGDTKKKVVSILDRLGNESFLIFSASANVKSQQVARGKQTGNELVELRKGLDEVEMSQWWIHFQNELPVTDDKDRECLQDLTGQMPLLLRPLFDLAKNSSNNAAQFHEVVNDFLHADVITKVKDDIDEFFIKMLPSIELSRSSFFENMSACLTEYQPQTKAEHLIDHRYFYFDNSVGHYTCGLARDAMENVLRTHKNDVILGSEWYSAVQQFSSNPVVQGFYVERVCLARIAMDGLKEVDTQLGRMEQELFDDQPAWNNFCYKSTAKCHLYVPRAYNFKDIDGVVLLLDRAEYTAHVIPIQITIAKHHKASDTDFYEQKWRKWTTTLMESGYKAIRSTFIWITRDAKTMDVDTVSPHVHTSRSGEKLLHSGYKRRKIRVRDVDRQLAIALGEP